jgi:beta-lactamase class A
MEELIDKLNALCDEQPFDTGWWLKDLRSGRTRDRNGDKIYYSASTRKIAIMMAALKGVNEGRFSLDQPVEVLEEYQRTNSSPFGRVAPGFSMTFRDFLIMMIILSDNTCTGTVVDMVGLDYINEFCASIGMVGTTHRQRTPPENLAWDHPVEETNATTAGDVGLLLDSVVQGTRDADEAARLGVTTELCQLGIDILSWQYLTEKLPAYLPQHTKVANKTGHGPRTRNDAGVVFLGEEPLYVLTVYTDRLPVEMPNGLPGDAEANMHIARLSRACYDALAGVTAAV